MASAKKIKKNAKKFVLLVVACGIAAPIVFFSVQRMVVSVRQNIYDSTYPRTTVCFFEHIYSETVARKIQNLITADARRSLFLFSPQTLFQELKKEFPIIKKIDCRLSASMTLNVTVQGVAPSFLVNNQFVVGDKRKLLVPSYFENIDLKKFKPVSVDESWCGEKLDKQTYAFLHSIPQDYWDRFNITYHAPYKIELVPKKAACACKIIADEKSFFVRDKIAKINNIFEDLARKGLLTKRIVTSKECKILFDIRFNERVYVKFLERIKRGAG
jgi:hypothetical protein